MNIPPHSPPPVRWAWLPIPALLAGIIALRFMDLQTSYGSPIPLAGLNVIFSTLASLAIAFLMARSFLVRPAPGKLMVGGGVLIWGFGSLVAPIIGWDNSNLLVTVHNMCLWLATWGFLAGVLLWRQPARAVSATVWWVGAAYLIALVLVWLIVQTVLAGWLPSFFVQGHGGTTARQFVLASAISMLLLGVALLRLGKNRARSVFAYWYTLALLLLAVGLFGVMIQSVAGSLLSWIGRAAQFLSGVYLVVAAFFSAQETSFPASVQTEPGNAKLRYLVAITIVITAAAVRFAFLKRLESHATYTTFYPAVMLAALYGGLGPGFLATVISGALASYYWIEPAGHFSIEESAHMLGLAIFVANGALISWGTQVMHHARGRAAMAEAQAQIALEREFAAQVVRASQERMAAFAAASFEGIVESEAGRIADCNEQFAQMVGSTVSDLKGTAVADLIAPEDRERVLANIGSNRDSVIEHAMLRKDGTRLIVEAHGRSVLPGSAARHTAVRDITERRRTEAALRESESKYRIVADNTYDWEFWLDVEDRFIYCSPSCERITGHTAAEFLTDPCLRYRLIHSDDRARFDEHERDVTHRRVVGEGEWRVMCPNGTWRWIAHVCQPVFDHHGRYLGRRGSNRDITERKEAEQALRQSEERLQLAQQAARIGTFDRNLSTNRTLWTKELEALYGLPPGGFQGSFAKWQESIHPDDRPAVLEAIRQGIADRSSFHMEFRASQPDGSLRWIAAWGKVICDEQGHPMRTVGANMDITDRKRAEEAIQKLNAELEQRVEERTRELRQTNQMLRMLTECNEALVRISKERELMQEVCRIVNEVGGYRMAWVGVAEQDEPKTVRPVATVGFEEGYLDATRISWADNEFGRGPTGTAIRSGKVCLGDDFLSQPNLAPWRQAALERGFRSSISLPLLTGGQAFGALTIYAQQPRAFDAAQVSLLSDLAADLSFGITALRVQADRDLARQNLEQRSLQLRALAGELAQAEQRERHRIAQVLHDQLQQLLVGARYQLDGMQLESSPADFAQAKQQVDDLLSQCLESSRSLTLELSPPILYEAGLVAALKWLGRWFRETHGFTVRVILEDQPAVENEELRVTLFLAVRELLFNAVKHAQVQQARVQVTQLPENQIKIVVSDRGAGFDPVRLQGKEGGRASFGLFSLRERLGWLGGWMEIESAVGRGSRFTLCVPLRASASGVEATRS